VTARLAAGWGRVRAARHDSLLRNSVFNMGTTIGTSALGFVYWVVAARLFDAHDVGIAATAVSAMMLAATLANPGLHTLLVERLPSRREGKDWSLTINVALLTGTVAGVLAGLCGLLIVPLLSSDFDVIRHGAFAALFVIGVPLTTAATVLDYVWIAERHAGGPLVRNCVFAAVKIPILALPTFAALDAVGIISSWVISLAGTAVATALLLPRLGKAYRITFRGGWRELHAVKARLVGHHFTNLGNLIPLNVLPILVAAALSPAMAAYFYATWRLAGLIFMVSPSIATSLFAEGANDAASLGAQARRAVRMTLSLLLPASAALAVLGYPLLLLFGPAYAREGFVLLLLLIAAAVPDGLGNLYLSVLRVQGRLVAAATLSIVPSLLALLLAWTLMPALQLPAVGVAWLAARIVVAAIAAFDLRRSGIRLPVGPDAELATTLVDSVHSAAG
jgi:O-antigen/teichoic acid export membrane protein